MARTETAITANAYTQAFRPCELVEVLKRNPPPAEIRDPYTRLPYLEAASQFFAAGDMVYLNAGAITMRLTADVAPIAGFALEGYSGTQGTARRIMPVSTSNVYAMNCYNIASGTPATYTIPAYVALHYVGGEYNLAQYNVTNLDGTTTLCTGVDFGAQTAARVKVVGIQKNPIIAATDQCIRVLVKFLPYVSVAGDPTYGGLQFDA